MGRRSRDAYHCGKVKRERLDFLADNRSSGSYDTASPIAYTLANFTRSRDSVQDRLNLPTWQGWKTRRQSW